MEGLSRRVQIKQQTEFCSDTERVNELLLQYQKNKKSVNLFKNQTKLKASQSNYLLQTGRKKWLCQKGKQYLVDFNQQQRRKLKTFFNVFDKKKHGFVGLDQLQQLMLGLGLAQGIEDIKKMIGNINQDHSGKLNFQQFIQMIQDDRKQNLVVSNFFKHLTFTSPQSNQKTLKNNTGYMKSTQPTQSEKLIFRKNLPFEVVISQIRRNHILSSMNIGRYKQNHKLIECNGGTRVAKGKQVVKAIQRMEERRLMRRLRQNSRENFQQINNQIK